MSDNIFDGLPSSIRIGPFEIPVLIVEKADDEWGSYTHGISIELRNPQPNAIFALDTVLHELAHGVYKTCSLGEHSTEEQICGAMATGFTQLLRDNPQLVSWIYRMLPPK